MDFNCEFGNPHVLSSKMAESYNPPVNQYNKIS
jgi:hypothetical protein